jgi:hypothetical protein
MTAISTVKFNSEKVAGRNGKIIFERKPQKKKKQMQN